MTANAYLGSWGVVEALNRGADVVVCPRVTDAVLTVAPAAWWHGWRRDDWDKLAAAVVAGHVIECGPQATGGNYPFYEELGDMRAPGFPIAEIAADGSTVITKHESHGGAVTVGTVTAQLLYEIGGPALPEPGRRGALRHDVPRAGGPGPRADHRRPRRAVAAGHEGLHQLLRRLPQLDDVRAGGAGHRPQGADDHRRAAGQARRRGPVRDVRRAADRERRGRSGDERAGVQLPARDGQGPAIGRRSAARSRTPASSSGSPATPGTSRPRRRRRRPSTRCTGRRSCRRR